MANHVISRVELESNSKEIHNYIQNFDESCTGINNSDSCDNTCKIVFGKETDGFNVSDAPQGGY